MQLHTLHHIHVGAAAIKAACAYICACVDPPPTHAHARLDGCRSLRRDVCHQAFTDHNVLFFIGNHSGNAKHENNNSNRVDTTQVLLAPSHFGCSSLSVAVLQAENTTPAFHVYAPLSRETPGDVTCMTDS